MPAAEIQSIVPPTGQVAAMSVVGNVDHSAGRATSPAADDIPPVIGKVSW
jgi:hypothetical protein